MNEERIVGKIVELQGQRAIIRSQHASGEIEYAGSIPPQLADKAAAGRYLVTRGDGRPDIVEEAELEAVKAEAATAAISDEELLGVICRNMCCAKPCEAGDETCKARGAYSAQALRVLNAFRASGAPLS